MSHLNEGTLRRMLDEPATTSAADSAHFATCEACRLSAESIKAEASGISALLAVPEGPVEPEVALLRVRRLAADLPPAGPAGILAGLRRRRAFRPVASTVLAFGLMGALVATGVADGVVQTFEPTQFTPVSINTGSLNSLPDLSKFGTYTIGSQPTFRSSNSAADALAGSGLSKVLVPASPLPRDVTGAAQYETFGTVQGSFTISREKAAAYEASIGKTLPDMPQGMDGTTISLTAGPGVITLYGGPDLSGLGNSAGGEAPRGAFKGGRDTFQIPSLAVVQMKVPRVHSDRASIQEMETYLAGLPGVPADLAAQIKAIGNPASTLPVPVPTGQGSHQVTINGESGLFVGDSTGLGAGVIWQHEGVLYAVVGTLSEGDVVAVANGLN
jgi:anti-sigma factor RsiW